MQLRSSTHFMTPELQALERDIPQVPDHPPRPVKVSAVSAVGPARKRQMSLAGIVPTAELFTASSLSVRGLHAVDAARQSSAHAV